MYYDESVGYNSTKLQVIDFSCSSASDYISGKRTWQKTKRSG